MDPSDAFQTLDIRVGRIVKAALNPKARKPSDGELSAYTPDSAVIPSDGERSEGSCLQAIGARWTTS